MKNAKPSVSNLTREKWLELALDALLDKCRAKFNLDSLIAAMPVTKGSFYSHFQNRTEFLLALVDFWDRNDTHTVMDHLKKLPETMSGERQLWELTRTIYDRQLYRHELLIRSIAFEFPEVRSAIERVDHARLKVVRDIFAKMGFEGMECEMRARLFITVVSQEHAIMDTLPEEAQSEFRKARHRFFIYHTDNDR